MNHQERLLLDQQMRKEVAAFKSSGHPIAQFCQDKSYTLHKLNYWVIKVKREESGQPATSSTKGFSTLKPGNIAGPTLSTPSAEIVYPNGMRVALYESVTANFLKSLL